MQLLLASLCPLGLKGLLTLWCRTLCCRPPSLGGAYDKLMRIWYFCSRQICLEKSYFSYYSLKWIGFHQDCILCVTLHVDYIQSVIFRIVWVEFNIAIHSQKRINTCGGLSWKFKMVQPLHDFISMVVQCSCGQRDTRVIITKEAIHVYMILRKVHWNSTIFTVSNYTLLLVYVTGDMINAVTINVKVSLIHHSLGRLYHFSQGLFIIRA